MHLAHDAVNIYVLTFDRYRGLLLLLWHAGDWHNLHSRSLLMSAGHVSAWHNPLMRSLLLSLGACGHLHNLHRRSMLMSAGRVGAQKGAAELPPWQMQLLLERVGALTGAPSSGPAQQQPESRVTNAHSFTCDVRPM